jgi:tetratricopeptide (TPR) repeat protein
MAEADHAALMAKGLAEQRARNFKAALATYARARAAGGGDAQLLLHIGECREALGDLAGADDAYGDAIARDPDLVAAYRRAIAMAERGRALALQVGQLGTAEALRQGAARHHAALGVRLVAKGAFREAETEFRAAADLAPEHWAPKVDLGRCLYEQGRLEAAEKAIRDGLRLAPSEPMAHLHLGLLLVRGGRSGEAKTALERALALDPGLAAAQAALASLAQ